MAEKSLSSSSSSLCFRVAIVGAHRNRVAKVLQILKEQKEQLQSQNDDDRCINEALLFLQEKIKHHNIKVEYLPCVAKFGSYQDENNKVIQYLSKLEYYGSDGKQVHGSSLAPFFDENNINDKNNDGSLTFPGISTVAIGCGIEDPNHIEMIKSFMKNMTQLILSSEDDQNRNDKDIDIIVESIKPNSEYSSMKEENEVYKNLNVAKKLEANQNESIGPGKMARFSTSLAQKALEAIFSTVTSEKKENESESDEGEIVSPATANIIDSNVVGTAHVKHSKKKQLTQELCDENKIRFACKICRTVLFGQEHLENPPHTKGRHQFNHRQKGSSDKSNGGECASVYLSSEMDWMGDTSNYEGKLACPKCNAKVGVWKWAGAQCSCGTWVTPAIQIVRSKVDIIHPTYSYTSSIIHNPSTSVATASLLSTDTSIPHNPSPPVNPLAGLYIASGNKFDSI